MKTVHLMTLQASTNVNVTTWHQPTTDSVVVCLLLDVLFSCSTVNNWQSVAICCQSPGFTVLVHNLMLSCLPGDVLVHIIS